MFFSGSMSHECWDRTWFWTRVKRWGDRHLWMQFKKMKMSLLYSVCFIPGFISLYDAWLSENRISSKSQVISPLLLHHWWFFQLSNWWCFLFYSFGLFPSLCTVCFSVVKDEEMLRKARKLYMESFIQPFPPPGFSLVITVISLTC